TRRYQALRDFKEAPVLPTGYAGMIVLSAVPQIWRSVMDKRVMGHYDGDLSLANVHPRTAKKYAKKYPGVAA
ncbi:MAG: alkane 1-monooxygenase, partial [Aeromicrobium sp.]|nr:alkane 1-monooxygenase [Aeromicrobium sp.]